MMSSGGDVPDEQLVQKHGLGATGAYPHGRVAPDDQGELKVAIAADPANRRVRIEFGKPVAWLSLTPEDALVLAEHLTIKARVLWRRPGDTLRPPRG
jgi:hypothetical protein